MKRPPASTLVLDWLRIELTCRGDRSHHPLCSSLLLVDLVDGGAGLDHGGQHEAEDDDVHGVRLSDSCATTDSHSTPTQMALLACPGPSGPTCTTNQS